MVSTCQNSNINNVNNLEQAPDTSMEEYLKQKDLLEDQIDYQFIQRIIQELTQSCALNVPIPVSAIPNLILQAAQYFWENDDQSIEERYYCIPYKAISKCGPNRIIKLPPQIISVFGVYKLTNNFKYGALGDFSLERMIINNSALASGVGGSLSNVFGSSTGYGLKDIMGAMYEVQTYNAMFDCPVTYNYNPFSNELVFLGNIGSSDILLQVFKRLKIQDLYKSYYFFRYCVCLGLRSMSTIMGTYEFKLPGGITLNYSVWRDQAEQEMDKIHQWILDNHANDYFFNTNTV